MGKGSRNRQRHIQEQLQNSGRKQQTKKAPKWLTPLISIVLVAAVLVGVVASVLTNSGIIYRNRIIVESKTGNYDITQQTATFLAWQSAYYNAYYYWMYAYLGYITDKTVTTNYSSADSYAFDVARYTVQNSLRDGVQELVESLVDYVAVCDAAEKAGVKLTDDELAEIDDTVDWLKDMQGSLGFASFNGFLKGAIGTGMKKSDIEHALEIVSLYNKYLSQVQEDFEEVATITDLEIFRDENPDDYFKTDYLSFKTEDKELSDKLATCTTADEFRETVVRHSFDKNYKATFNKFTVTQQAADELKKVGDKTDANSSALTDALNEIGVGAKTTYTKESTDIPTEVRDWLFKTVRTQYEVSTVATENGVYLVANYTEKVTADTTSVEARVKFYEFAEGESYGDDANFKSSLQEQLLAYKLADALAKDLTSFPEHADKLLAANNAIEKTGVNKDTADVPSILLDKLLADGVKEEGVITATEYGLYYVAFVRAVADDKLDVAYCTFGVNTEYRSGLELQAEFKKALTAVGAMPAELMAEKNAVTKKGVTSSTASTIVPSAITKVVISSTVNTGDILTASDSSGYYVIYVQSIEKLTADISYVTFTNDTYYSILTAMQTTLDTTGNFPTTATQNYVTDAKKDSFEEWISESGEKFAPVRKEFDTKVIESTEQNSDKKDVTKYTAYMVLHTPLYLELDPVVNGGYLQFTDPSSSDTGKKDPHATQAADALAKLTGKTGYELRDALSELGSAQVSTSFAEKAITDANVRAWLFDENRKENDVAVVTSEDGKSSYVVVFFEQMISWQRSAKTAYVEDQIESWIDEMIKTEGYAVNEDMLNKLGKLTETETETETGTETEAETEAATDAETEAATEADTSANE